MQSEGDSLEVNFNDDWKNAHPLTVWEVAESIAIFKKAGVSLALPSD